MKTMPLTTLPEKCWIFFKGRYVLRNDNLPKLPWIGLEYERFLKFYNIPYRKVVKKSFYPFSTNSEVVCEYWNPETGLEEEDLSLPLYAQIGDSYRYCEKKYSDKIPTFESIEAAKKTEKFVLQEMANYEEILREVGHYRFVKEKLSDNIAIVCPSYSTPYNSIHEINMNHEHFKLLRVPIHICISDWVAIFNMNKIAPNGCITLKAPKDIVGYIIGKGGSNIKAWALEIGVKKINVIPI